MIAQHDENNEGTAKPETNKQVVLVRETTVSSVIQDFCTFGVIVLAYWFNHVYIGDNGFLEVLLFIAFFTVSFSHLKNFKKLREEINK